MLKPDVRLTRKEQKDLAKADKARRKENTKRFKADMKRPHIQVDTVNKLFKVNVADVYEYGQLLDYDIYQDIDGLQKGSLGKAVVGGLLFGAAGAVVGGLATKRQKFKVNTFVVRIKVDTNEKYLLSIGDYQLMVNLLPPFLSKEKTQAEIDSMGEMANNLIEVLDAIKAEANE